MRAWAVKEQAVDATKAADLKRHELEQLVAANYNKASDTIAGAWNENSMKSWLVKHGVIKSDAQATRDQVVADFDKHYSKVAGKTNDYLSWTDARIRGWLRHHNVDVPRSANRDELVRSMHENCQSSAPLSSSLLFESSAHFLSLSLR